jgi:hypothetical protein
MTVPAWVRKRDGRVVPFRSDAISRSLFAATETLGRPDAFLARELTDGVLHFLSGEAEGHVPTTADIAELVARVVRELGQSALSRAYADRTRPGQQTISVEFAATEPLTSVIATCLSAYSLGAVFSRDLAAAHRDGLLTLCGLDAPLQLIGSGLGPTGPLWERLLDARQYTSSFLALDAAEHHLGRSILRADDAADGFVRQLQAGLSGTSLQAVVNLNGVPPGAGAEEIAEGPLFSRLRASPDADRLTALADALLHAVAGAASSARIEWHLSERDFVASAERLRRVARLAAEGGAVAFAFDRPGHAVALAAGLDRRHPALLLTVGLNLARLADQAGTRTDVDVFLQKLGTLARWAVSAAVQKREFVRQGAADDSPLRRGFLLERARLLVAPTGLAGAVRTLSGSSLRDDRGVELGRRILDRLREVLRAEGAACLINATLDAAPTPGPDAEEGGESAVPSARAQLAAADALQGAGGGTAVVRLPADAAPRVEDLAESIRWAWQHTGLGRLVFLRPAAGHRQLTLPS